MTIKFTRRSVCALGAAALGCAAFPPFAAEDPIRIIVPYPPGGPLDVTARAVAEEARHDLGNIIVENKPGAGGNIGVDYVAKQAPDGKTIVMGALATHAVNPNLFSKLPYDPIKDFTPITLIAQTPNVLVITPEFSQKTGIKSVKDLIEYAKKNPDAINYASGGNGSAGHMSGELLKNATGIKIVHIPFKGRQIDSSCRDDNVPCTFSAERSDDGRSRCPRIRYFHLVRLLRTGQDGSESC